MVREETKQEINVKYVTELMFNVFFAPEGGGVPLNHQFTFQWSTQLLYSRR
jgi:hypothetical protein